MCAADNRSPVFKLAGVSYASASRAIVDDVSLEINPGDVLGISGASGSGKTTLLLLMAGALAPTGGNVFFRGGKVGRNTLPGLRRSVAFVAQEPPLEPGAVRESLLLPFSFKANRDLHPDDEALRACLDRVRLGAEVLDQQTDKLSGGEKQRVAIARALLLKRDVLLLDEVTSALDEDCAGSVMDLLTQPGLTVVSVSHDRAWLERCSRTLQVDSGRLEEVAACETS